MHKLIAYLQKHIDNLNMIDTHVTHLNKDEELKKELGRGQFEDAKKGAKEVRYKEYVAANPPKPPKPFELKKDDPSDKVALSNLAAIKHHLEEIRAAKQSGNLDIPDWAESKISHAAADVADVAHGNMQSGPERLAKIVKKMKFRR